MSRKVDTTDYKGLLEKYQSDYQTCCRVYSKRFFGLALLLIGIAALDYCQWEGKALHFSVISFDDKALAIGGLFFAFFGALSHRASKQKITLAQAAKFLEKRGVTGSREVKFYYDLMGAVIQQPEPMTEEESAKVKEAEEIDKQRRRKERDLRTEPEPPQHDQKIARRKKRKERIERENAVVETGGDKAITYGSHDKRKGIGIATDGECDRRLQELLQPRKTEVTPEQLPKTEVTAEQPRKTKVTVEQPRRTEVPAKKSRKWKVYHKAIKFPNPYPPK